MNRKTSEELQKRNEEIRQRRRAGESRKALAAEYGMKPGTISAIVGGYKGTGYTFEQDGDPDDNGHVDPVRVERAVLGSRLDLQRSAMSRCASRAREKRETMAALLDNIYATYKGSTPGTCAAELAICEMCRIANILARLESQVLILESVLGEITDGYIRLTEHIP